MIFREELAAKVMAGEKTVTRRLVSENPRSPWFTGGCSLKRLGNYAVCPGRGKHAIGRVQVLEVTRQRLGRVTDDEARKEGFATVADFEQAFAGINGKYDPDAIVYRIEFRRHRA